MTALAPWHRPLVSSADLCRVNGWTVGTRIVGSDGADEQRLTISAVGTQLVLAYDRGAGREIAVDLRYRRWRLDDQATS